MFQKNPQHSGTGSHKFSQVPTAEISRSSFDRSHGYTTAMPMDFLIPIYLDEALPGDTFNLKENIFARLATPLHPLMTNMYLDTFYFAVPNRLLWDNWERFNGAQTDPGDSTDFLVPQVLTDGNGHTDGSMGDYFGLPTNIAATSSNALFFRAMNLIYNEWFRDENLVDALPKNMGDGPDVPGDYMIQKRAKKHDYFVSALPWPQKGPSVELPLGTSAPVITSPAQNYPTFAADGIGARTLSMQASSDVRLSGAAPAGDEAMTWATSGLIADLSQATAATINALRQAFQIQKLYERDARGGTRYTEILRSHFQIISPDARLQRPEYLGGSSTRITQDVVPQTSVSAGTPQGHLTSYGTAQSSNPGFVKSFTEHSVIIGMVAIRADLTYSQGMERMHSRNTRWDFYWPALQNIGEQALLNKEIYMDGTSADDDVFGYQERWSEYRHKPSRITGLMRPGATGTLASWHLSQDFGALPVLNQDFIESTTPIGRVIAVQSEPAFIFDAWFNLNCVRPMPTYSVPGMIDHF